MSISQSDLDSFHDFATVELNSRGTSLTWEELLEKWQSREAQAETIASISRGVRDSEAGRVRSLPEVDAAIRAKLGFPNRGR